MCPEPESAGDVGVHLPAERQTPHAEQCRQLRAVHATAVVLARPGFPLALPGDAYFEAGAVHVAVVAPPTNGAWHHRPDDSLQSTADAVTAYLDGFDVVFTSQALPEGLAASRHVTGWLGNTHAGDAAARLQRVAADAAAQARRQQQNHAAWAVYAHAATAAAGRVDVRVNGLRRRTPVAACSQLPGPPLPGHLPPGAGADSGVTGRLAPADEASGSPVALVALCASVRDGAPFLDEWFRFHLAAGVHRAYMYDDNSTDGTKAVLHAWSGDSAAGFVTQLAPLHGPTRFAITQRTPAGGWSGQREVLARCLTHALLDGVHWLIPADLDEYIVPKAPHASIGAALAALPEALCVTVRRHGALRDRCWSFRRSIMTDSSFVLRECSTQRSTATRRPRCPWLRRRHCRCFPPMWQGRQVSSVGPLRLAAAATDVGRESQR